MDFGNLLFGIGVAVVGATAIIFGVGAATSGINRISAETGIKLPQL